MNKQKVLSCMVRVLRVFSSKIVKSPFVQARRRAVVTASIKMSEYSSTMMPMLGQEVYTLVQCLVCIVYCLLFRVREYSSTMMPMLGQEVRFFSRK